MKIAAIALNTAREALRNKLLYSILAFACLVVAVSALFGSASLGDPMKFVKDFSLMSLSVSGVVIATVVGVNMLGKELGRKTIFNILAKPVARWEFIVGKFCGLFGTLALVVTLMGAALVVLLVPFEGRVDWGIAIAVATALVELLVVVAVALFFSAFVVTPTLAGMFTIGTFIAGRSVATLVDLGGEQHAPAVRLVAKVLYWALPHLDRLYIADRVVYGDHIPATYLLAMTAYAGGYAGILLVLTVLLFSRREFV